MKTILILARCDLQAVKSWFLHEAFSKILVIIGFLAVGAAIFYGLFKGAEYYFRIIAPFGVYGWLTADYVLRAGVLIIFWLGLGSSIAQIIRICSTSDRQTSYLLSLPVKPEFLMGWAVVKLVITNIILLIAFIFPLALAVLSVFKGPITFIYILRIFFILFSLSVIVSAVGGITTLVLLKTLPRRNYFVSLFGILFYILLTAGIFRTIFPPQMAFLASSSPVTFITVYNSLPLAGTLIPTNWLAGIITEGGMLDIMSVLWIMCVAFPVFVIFLSRDFYHFYQAAAVSSAAFRDRISNRHINNLYSKDLLLILRSPSEMGYGIFLLLLMFLFFALFSRSVIASDLRTIAFSGFLFFSVTLLLRFVFPSMAGESQSAWYLFTLPVTRTQILLSKIRFSLLISLPLFLMAALVWWRQPMIMFGSLLAVLVLTLMQTFLGSIYPNFAAGGNAEKISTGTMGLTTFVFSFITAAVFVYLVTHYSASVAIFLQLFCGFGTVLISFLIARKYINRYQF